MLLVKVSLSFYKIRNTHPHSYIFLKLVLLIHNLEMQSNLSGSYFSISNNSEILKTVINNTNNQKEHLSYIFCHIIKLLNKIKLKFTLMQLQKTLKSSILCNRLTYFKNVMFDHNLCKVGCRGHSHLVNRTTCSSLLKERKSRE